MTPSKATPGFGRKGPSLETWAVVTGTAVVTILIFLGIILRFHGLDERGLDGSDAVYYTSVAEEWARGNPTFRIDHQISVYRPVVFFLFSTALKVFGHTDYAIKTLNACLDAASVLLIYAICVPLARPSRWPAFAAAALYAWLPMAIHMSRLELTHTTSTFLVLSSFWFFIRFSSSRNVRIRYLWLALCGASTGAAALAHQELLFGACGYLAFLVFLQIIRRSQSRAFSIFLLECSILCGGTLLVASKTIALHFKSVGRLVGAGEARATESWFDIVDRAARWTWNGIAANSSPAVLYLFLLAVALMACSLIRGARWRAASCNEVHVCACLPPLMIAVHMALYSFFFDWFLVRLFLPLVPLVIIAVSVWSAIALDVLRVRWAGGIVIVLATLLIALNFDHYRGVGEYLRLDYAKKWTHSSDGWGPDLVASYRHFVTTNYRTSWPRTIYDLLENRVTERARLLVTSSIMYPFPGRRPLQTRVYFGDDAVYLIDHHEPLDAVVDRMNVKYVLFTGFHADQRILSIRALSRYRYGGRWSEKLLPPVGASYGFAKGEYTMMREYRALKKFAVERNAGILIATGDYVGEGPKVIPRDESFIIFELGP